MNMRKGESTFEGSFESTTFDERIKGIAGRPDVIVRLGEIIDKNQVEQVAQARERYRQSEQNFQELRDFGVAIPTIETIFQEEEDGVRPCIKTERIIGKNLSDTIFADANNQEGLVSELGKCFDGLVSYFQAKKNKGGYFVGDLKNVQFVFGHKVGEDHSRPYLVDVDPFFNHREANKPIDLKFFSTLSGILAMMDAWIVKWQNVHPEEPIPSEWHGVINQHLKLIAECLKEASQDQFTQRFIGSFQGRINAFVDLLQGKRLAVKSEGDFNGWGGQEA